MTDATIEAGEAPVKPRKPLVAFILSFLLTGLGQVYAGRMGRGLALFFVSLVLEMIGTFALLPISQTERIFCLVVCGVAMVIWLYAIFDAVRLASRAPADYRLKDYNRVYVYVLFFLLQVPPAIAAAMYIRSDILTAYRMVGDGMAPEIRDGDRVLANHLAYRSEQVRRGDVVALINPNIRSRTSVRRVVALPGDRVAVAGGIVTLNGKVIDTPATAAGGSETAPATGAFIEDIDGRKYAVTIPASPPEDASLPEMVIPNGQCLLLGDNRGNTYDSRAYGLVPLADIIGRVDWTYWPRWKTIQP